MVTSELSIKQWDVVVVPFPYSDKLAEKRRPALVVSSKKFNSETGLLWVAMITSTTNIGWYGDVEIPIAGKSGLTTPSIIRTAKLATIELSRFISSIGGIEKRTSNKVKQIFLDSFQL
jgi:mRNA interferase MazF